MTKSRPRRRWFVSTLAAGSVALLSLTTPANPALASPAQGALSRPSRVNLLNLRIDAPTATRVLALEEGASQAPDSEKPKAMDDQATAAASKAAGPKKPEPPEDKFAFAKEWPFWVIVGGVVVAGAATFMLVRNANDTPPCGARYTAGCFGAR